jgi:hypothetical protein
MTSKNTAFLPGYVDSLKYSQAKACYKEKVDKIGGLDQYKTTRSEWEDNIDLWPSVHVAMYLLPTPSFYTGEDLVNYKSMDCYCQFLAGWIREILIKTPSETLRVVIAKVSYTVCTFVYSYL